MAATSPGVCSRAALGSAHQPALISGGTEFAVGSQQTCTLVLGDPHLLLADASKCRPVSINHIPQAHSVQLHELRDTEMDAFNF